MMGRKHLNKGGEKENYLNYIPKHNVLFPYRKKENGRIEVEVLNRGFFNRIAQIFFKRPKRSYIELDDFGSFVWEQIDGSRSIYDICMLIRERFGEEAEPLFERASAFFRILRSNSFIIFVNKL